MENIQLFCGDCLEVMKGIPDGSVDLVLTDPPYNVQVKTKKNGKAKINEWDKIDGYINWCVLWLNECSRVLKPNGVLYFWHNDMAQIAQLLEAIREKTPLEFISFCIWDKGDGYRAQSWKNRDRDGKTALRSWFAVCEYCLHFFNTTQINDRTWKATGLDRINSNPECYKSIKDWYAAEKKRIGLTDKDIGKYYTEVTGKKPYMLRHYFCDSQFAIPTQNVWKSVYMPLGFRREYEDLRREYEDLRNVHNVDRMHCNIWHEPPIPTQNRFHTCEKPVKILSRLIEVSTKSEDSVVLDLFMGGGSTGVACINTNRRFIGIEKDPKYFEIAKNRIESEVSQLRF